MSDRTQTCPTCQGEGTVTIPSIETKIAYHLMNSPAMGLGLKPDEVAELAAVLGLVPDPGPVPPEPGPAIPPLPPGLFPS